MPPHQAAEDGSGRIVARGLTKTFGAVKAVDDLTFTVEPGSITGFLGPNGAGKSTTMRMMLGLAAPTAGSSTISGVSYSHLAAPTRTVGAVLDTTFHPGRTGRNHLRVYAAAAGLPDARADHLLDQVGLAKAGRRKAGDYSLGMRQRLGLAVALLGDPKVLVLDEPANGLDPEGITWLRRFLRHLASQGRTILISSHLLGEVQQTVDRVVIIARGHLVREGTIPELAGSIEQAVVVRGPDLTSLRAELQQQGVRTADEPGQLRAFGVPTEQIGDAAFRTSTLLHELREDKKDLEFLYFQLTEGQGEYAGSMSADNDPAGGFTSAPDGDVR